MSKDKLRVLVHSNGSKMLTGFGKNAKNILLALYKDPDIEPIEAANGSHFGQDLKTPWESYGTFPTDATLLSQIQNDGVKQRAASYGFYTIDEIIKKAKPDVYLGIEDIWAFTEFQNKPWWNKIPSLIWTTLDSLPILPQAEQIAPKTDGFFVWAGFAEKAMKQKGFEVKTIHGAVDYEHFYPLDEEVRQLLKKKHDLENTYVVGFVFKNQLRKSVPNILEGFKIFQEENPNIKTKLLLHTDWSETQAGWDIPAYIEEKGVNKEDILSVYSCKMCKEYKIMPYVGNDQPCPFCGGGDSLVSKSSGHGCSERQLNELYNIMDVYCHPFTSGGQEIPIQEAKAAGLITLVTNYSCGTDAVLGKTGGLPLDWAEYREPHTNFIKSTTLPRSIADNLKKHYLLEEEEKNKLVQQSIDYVQKEYSVKGVVEKLKKEILRFGKTTFDFEYSEKTRNVDYNPIETDNDEEWLIDVYKGVSHKELSPQDAEIIAGKSIIEQDGRETLLNFIKHEAKKKNDELQRPSGLEAFLGDEGIENRIVVVIPESAGDVLMVNSLMEGLHQRFPDKKIYVITKEEYFDMINDNPFVYRLIPYQDGFNNLLYLEGRGEHKGFFQIAFLPAILTQMHLGYLHNGVI